MEAKMKPSSLVIASLIVGCNSSKEEIDDSRCAYAMTLCTIAGTGTSGYNDINIRARDTQLRDPTAIVEDAAGRLLVSDAGNNQIRRFEGDNLMSVIGRNARSEAVSGLASQTPLNYVVDMDFAADGSVLLLEGVGLQLSWVDLDNDQLEVYASSVGMPEWNSAEVTDIAEIGLIKPTSTAMDEAGNIYVSEAGEGFNMVLKISPEGEVTKIAGVDESGQPIASTSTDADDAQNYLRNPQGLVWHEGELYLADAGRHRIVRIDVETGEAVNIAGVTDAPGYGDGNPLTLTQLDRPSRFTFSPDGRLVIADSGNGVIRAELADGTMETVCGRGSGGYEDGAQDPEMASLGEPFDILYDANGDLVFTDRDHAVVRRITQPDW